MILKVLLAATIAAAPAAQAASIEFSPQEAQQVLNFLARTDIKGAEAPQFMALAQKFSRVVLTTQGPPPDTMPPETTPAAPPSVAPPPPAHAERAPALPTPSIAPIPQAQ